MFHLFFRAKCGTGGETASRGFCYVFNRHWGEWNSKRIAYSIKISFLFLCKIYSDLLPSDIKQMIWRIRIWKKILCYVSPAFRCAPCEEWKGSAPKRVLWSTGWWSARNFKFNSWAEIEEASWKTIFGGKLSMIASGFNQGFALVWKYPWEKCKIVAMSHDEQRISFSDDNLVSVIGAVRSWNKFQRNFR